MDSQFRKTFLLLLVVTVSLALVVLLESFVLTIVLAAVMAGLLFPFYTWLSRRLNGRPVLAAALTLLVTIVLILGPLLGIVSLVVTQAASVTTNIRPVVERFISEPTYLDEQLQRLPGWNYLEPYREEILRTAGDVVNSAGSFLVSSLSNTTKGTVTFVFNFFIALYTMFFFLIDGPGLLAAVLDHIPLRRDEKVLLTDRFMSVTRATIKGTIVIGVLQGVLSGLAFWVVGIPNAAFWTVLMAVLSILPLIGSALVWLPASIILYASGDVTQAIILVLFCSLIVGSVDNVLRPRLVGHDTKMHDLVILFSTLGGIVVIGPVGFIIGPVLAGLFVTSWQIFGIAYRDQLADGTPKILDADGEVIDE